MPAYEREIPTAMTHGSVPDVAPSRGMERAILGPSLTYKMVHFLDTGMKETAEKSNLSNLAHINKKAHEAFALRDMGHCHAEIARKQKCSERTVKTRVEIAKRFLLERIKSSGEDETAIALACLKIEDPQSWKIYVMQGGGHTLRQISSILDIDQRTAERGSAKAKKYVGPLTPTLWQRIGGGSLVETTPDTKEASLLIEDNRTLHLAQQPPEPIVHELTDSTEMIV